MNKIPQQTMESKPAFSQARSPEGEYVGCSESCCSVCCFCCCRPAFAKDYAVAECSGVCCYKWCALAPHIGYTCCTVGCGRCYRGCPLCCPCRQICCTPYVPYDEWTCGVHLLIAGLRSLIARVPMENIYAARALTDSPVPFLTWPLGVTCRQVRTKVDGVECADGVERCKQVRAEWMTPSGFEPNGKVVLYFHGGAFVFGSAANARFHTGLLARRLGCRLLSCDYPRPPKHPYPEPLDSAYATWLWLTAEGEGKGGMKPRDVIMSGDSAGGNLAISLTRRIKAMGQKLPGGLMLFSPWVEMIPFLSQSWECNKDYDFIAVKDVLHKMVDLYTDQEDPGSASVSPGLADVDEYKDWPPVFISVGGAEVLRTSIENFGKKLTQANVKTVVYTGKGMPHVFQLLAMATPAPEASVLPCCLRCCGGGWCCHRSAPLVRCVQSCSGGCCCSCCPPEDQPEHPVWESMTEARSFLERVVGAGHKFCWN